jgi:hypothetical protein
VFTISHWLKSENEEGRLVPVCPSTVMTFACVATKLIFDENAMNEDLNSSKDAFIPHFKH